MRRSISFGSCITAAVIGAFVVGMSLPGVSRALAYQSETERANAEREQRLRDDIRRRMETQSRQLRSGVEDSNRRASEAAERAARQQRLLRQDAEQNR